MFNLSATDKEKFFYITVSLLLTVIILFSLRHVFWRPFNTSSESQDAIVFLKFVIANDAGLGINPFVAREPDLRTGTIQTYTHWTNGYYLLANIIIKLFNAQTIFQKEMAIRTIAIFSTLAAVFIIVAAVAPGQPFLYFAAPLLLLTNTGRDALSFPWRDLFFMAVALYLISRYRQNRIYRYLFWLSLIVLPLFLQVVIPYLGMFIIIDYLIYKNKKEFLINMFWFLIGGAITFSVLLYGLDGNILKHWQDLHDITIARTTLVSFVTSDPSLSFSVFFRFLLRRIYESLNMGLAGIIFVAASLFLAFQKKRWWLTALIPVWIIYGIFWQGALINNYYFYISYVLFILVVFLFGASHLISQVVKDGYFRKKGLELLFVMFLGLNFYIFPTVYPIKDPIKDRILAPPLYPLDAMVNIRKDLDKLLSGDIKEQIEQLHCNAFEFESYEGMDGWVPGGAKAFLGQYVIERAKNKAPLRRCLIMIGKKSVSLLKKGN